MIGYFNEYVLIYFSSPPDSPDHGNGLYNSSNEFQRLPSVTVHQIDSNNHDPDGSFEDDDTDIDQTDSQCQVNYITAHVLYDFDGKKSIDQSC